MSKPKQGGSSLNVDEGSYPMVIKSVFDLGTQPKKSFGKDGKENEDEDKEGPQIFVEAEMPEYESDEETVVSSKSEPALIGMWLNNTASSDRSNLYKLMKACGIKNPADTDLDELLGKSFNGEVGKTNSGKPKVKGFAPLAKGQKVGKTFAPTRSFYLDDSFDEGAFESAPKFIQDKVVTSPEYEKIEAKQKAKKGGKKK